MILLLPALMAAACAPLSEAERAEREYRRGDYRAKFLDYKRRCEDLGGSVIIRSRSRIGPDGMPDLGDHYYCQLD